MQTKNIVDKNILHDFTPCMVDVDENCLFKALSFSLYGAETFHEEIRVIEMVINS